MVLRHSFVFMFVLCCLFVSVCVYVNRQSDFVCVSHLKTHTQKTNKKRNPQKKKYTKCYSTAAGKLISHLLFLTNSSAALYLPYSHATYNGVMPVCVHFCRVLCYFIYSFLFLFFFFIFLLKIIFLFVFRCMIYTNQGSLYVNIDIFMP